MRATPRVWPVAWTPSNFPMTEFCPDGQIRLYKLVPARPFGPRASVHPCNLSPLVSSHSMTYTSHWEDYRRIWFNPNPHCLCVSRDMGLEWRHLNRSLFIFSLSVPVCCCPDPRYNSYDHQLYELSKIRTNYKSVTEVYRLSLGTKTLTPSSWRNIHPWLGGGVSSDGEEIDIVGTINSTQHSPGGEGEAGAPGA